MKEYQAFDLTLNGERIGEVQCLPDNHPIRALSPYGVHVHLHNKQEVVRYIQQHLTDRPRKPNAKNRLTLRVERESPMRMLVETDLETAFHIDWVKQYLQMLQDGFIRQGSVRSSRPVCAVGTIGEKHLGVPPDGAAIAVPSLEMMTEAAAIHFLNDAVQTIRRRQRVLNFIASRGINLSNCSAGKRQIGRYLKQNNHTFTRRRGSREVFSEELALRGLERLMAAELSRIYTFRGYRMKGMGHGTTLSEANRKMFREGKILTRSDCAHHYIRDIDFLLHLEEVPIAFSITGYRGDGKPLVSSGYQADKEAYLGNYKPGSRSMELDQTRVTFRDIYPQIMPVIPGIWYTLRLFVDDTMAVSLDDAQSSYCPTDIAIPIMIRIPETLRHLQDILDVLSTIPNNRYAPNKRVQTSLVAQLLIDTGIKYIPIHRMIYTTSWLMKHGLDMRDPTQMLCNWFGAL